MNFVQAISTAFSKYVNFSDRAVRSEYWYWALFTLLIIIAASILDGALAIYVFVPIVSLALFLPSFAVQVRRLHDLDRSGWWILLHLIPIIGPIWLIVWYCTKGTEGPNRFGPDRLAALGAQAAPRLAA
jgi:uncharacterized membrane protein YhaH (DUF805 family)